MYLSLFSLLQHLPFHTFQDHLATAVVTLKMHTCPLSAGVVEMLFGSGRKQAALGQNQFLRRGKNARRTSLCTCLNVELAYSVFPSRNVTNPSDPVILNVFNLTLKKQGVLVCK